VTALEVTPASRCLSVALELAAAGYALLPVVLELKPDGDKQCTFPYDRAGARLRSSTDPDQIRAWWVDDPRRSFAVDVHASGVEVVDLDVGLDGDPVGERSWGDLPRGALQVRTRSGGWQFYFRRRPNGVALGNSAGRLPKVDTRGAVNDLAFAPGAWLVNAPEQAYTAVGAIVAADRLSPVPDVVVAAVGAPAGAPASAVMPDDPFAAPTEHSGVFTPDQALTYCRHVIARLAACAPDGKYTALIAAARSLGKFEALGVKEWLWERCREALHTSAVPVKDWAHARRGFDDSWANAVKAGDRARILDAHANPFDAAPDAPGQTGATGQTLADQLLRGSQLRGMAAPRPLIAGVLGQGSLALLTGMNQSYKSFVALDWALSVATGLDWMGHAVKRSGPVLYVAAEGANGVRKRALAWTRARGLDDVPEDFLLLPRAVQFRDSAGQAELAELAGTLGVVQVVIDTVHQSASGLNENDSGDMSVVMAAARRLTSGGATVLLVHHTGHEGLRARGSSSLTDDADEAWTIWREPTEQSPGLDCDRILRHAKSKDSELHPEIVLAAAVTLTGTVDADGEPETSLTLSEVKETPGEVVWASVAHACHLVSVDVEARGLSQRALGGWLAERHPEIAFRVRSKRWLADLQKHVKECMAVHSEYIDASPNGGHDDSSESRNRGMKSTAPVDHEKGGAPDDHGGRGAVGGQTDRLNPFELGK